MTSITVTCGCGRQMREVGTAPKGTYACGCGARVRVQSTHTGSCTAQADGGSRCRVRPWPKSAELGVSLCKPHFDGYVETLRLIKRAEELTEELFREYAKELHDDMWRIQFEAALKQQHAEAVVYYMRIGDVIKIGTTINMRRRLTELMPDELLATEPGTYELETARHQQFATLKVRGERFRAAPELMSHVAMIRAHFGEPKITGGLRAPDVRSPLTLAEIMEAADKATAATDGIGASGGGA